MYGVYGVELFTVPATCLVIKPYSITFVNGYEVRYTHIHIHVTIYMLLKLNKR